jgi:hypothetical protein
MTSVLNEEKQEIKHLRLKLDRPAVMQKTTSSAVKREALKLVDLSISVVHEMPVLRLRPTRTLRGGGIKRFIKSSVG